MVSETTFKQTEIGLIPDDWEIVKIGNSFKFKNGLNKEKDFFGYGYPIVNYMDVYKNTFLTPRKIKGKVYVTNNEIRSFNVNKGDVLFTRTSETHEEIGLTAVILKDLNQTVFSGFLLRARPFNSKFNYEFCRFCFDNKIVRVQIINKASYTTRALTNGRVLSEILIQLPPLHEQKVIAQALNDVEVWIENLEKLLAKKRLIKKGAMQKLLTPKEDWEVKKLGDIVTITSGESPSKFAFQENGIPYLKVDELNNTSKYTSAVSYFIESKKFIPKGALIFPKRGASIFLNKIRILGEDSYMDTNLMTLTVSESFNSEFLYYSLIHFGLDQIADTTSIPQINNKHILPIEILFPMFSEQTCIATILSDMDTEMETLESKLLKARQIKQGMMQELLTGRVRLV